MADVREAALPQEGNGRQAHRGWGQRVDPALHHGTSVCPGSELVFSVIFCSFLFFLFFSFRFFSLFCSVLFC